MEKEGTEKKAFLLWIVCKCKVLTINHLQDREFRMASRCVLCLANEETSDHIYFSYTFSKQNTDIFFELDDSRNREVNSFVERMFDLKLVNLSREKRSYKKS